MGITMGQQRGLRQVPQKSLLGERNGRAAKWPCAPWLIILKVLGLSYAGGSLTYRCNMRTKAALLAFSFLLAATAASADSRVFIIANQADGYGIDQCLARGEKCGANAARSYCQSRDFAQATSYRRVDPDEITGSVPKDAASCNHAGCNEYVAITCQR
jgi:hypothetical protein